MSTPYVAFSLRTSLRRLTTASFLATLLSSSSPAFASTDFVAPPGRSSNPYSIVVGPDKNLWFTETGGEKIGRLTTFGVLTQFPIAGAVQLVGIASGCLRTNRLERSDTLAPLAPTLRKALCPAAAFRRASQPERMETFGS
jgi:hypothetical protein